MPFVRPVLSGPGVYFQEVPSGARTITGAATSITAFVGRAAWGPVNDPTDVYSWEDFEMKFGGLQSDMPLAYAVQDFFANGGGTAIIIRLFALKTGDDIGDYTQSISPDMNNLPTAATVAANTLTQSQAKLATAKKAVEAADTAVKALPPNDPGLQAAQGKLTTARQALTAAEADVAKNQQALTTAGASLALNLVAASPGKWGSYLSYTTDKTGINDGVINRYKTLQWDAKDLFNITIKLDMGAAGQFNERFTSVSTNANSAGRNLGLILAANSKLARLVDQPGSGVGEDSGLLAITDYDPGLAQLSKVDLFNLLVIPPDTRDGDTPPLVYKNALGYCTAARATLIVDPPAKWSGDISKIQPDQFPADIGITPGDDAARFAAVYFPRICKPDPLLGGAVDTFTPSGVIAGVIARTDASRGVWKAPAGTESGMTGVNRLETKLADQEIGQLNSHGVNCLRSLAATGPVVWGARTVRGSDQLADDYKYLPVRRLADYIEQTLLRSTQWAVFEPNDEPLWAQLRTSIGTFMADLFRQGAFQGASRDQAYFVKCDGSTTPQSDIDLGLVNVVIGFAPLKPAEFVVLYLQQMTNQAAG